MSVLLFFLLFKINTMSFWYGLLTYSLQKNDIRGLNWLTPLFSICLGYLKLLKTVYILSMVAALLSFKTIVRELATEHVPSLPEPLSRLTSSSRSTLLAHVWSRILHRVLTSRRGAGRLSQAHGCAKYGMLRYFRSIYYSRTEPFFAKPPCISGVYRAYLGNVDLRTPHTSSHHDVPWQESMRLLIVLIARYHTGHLP